MGVLRVFVCGRLALACDEGFVPESALPGRQGRRFWAYLILNRQRPVARAELAEAIWGDSAPDAWDNALSALASKVRTALRPVSALAPALAIAHSAGRYEVALPAGAVVDIERAKEALHEAERFKALEDFNGVWAEARIAMEVARRGFLPGEDEPWIEAERRSLVDVHLRAAELTVRAELGRGQVQSAVTEARNLVRTDPLRESAYRLLMRALAATANNAEVASVMKECRAAMGRAGVSASAETERLFAELVGATTTPEREALVKGGTRLTRTFLFADLRDYTSFVERHGDEAAAALIARYRELVRGEIKRAAGAEVKTEGDSFYVTFLSAQQTLDAAIAILRAADRTATSDKERQLRIGIGLHAGEPVPQEGQYVGSAVNIAARLAQNAGPGELLVSDVVRGLLRTSGLPEMEERRGLVLKGVRDAPRAYSVRWK